MKDPTSTSKPAELAVQHPEMTPEVSGHLSADEQPADKKPDRAKAEKRPEGKRKKDPNRHEEISLTAEDHRILDEVWAEIAAERKKKTERAADSE